MENSNDDSVGPKAEKQPYKYPTGADHWTQKRKAAQAPKDGPVSVQEEAAPVTADVVDERQAYNDEVARIRKSRKPLGSFTQKLAYATRPGYHRHWFNDIPGRIDEAKISGWANVSDKGQPVKRVVGTGRDKGALYAYLMEIPSVFWDEDMAAQFERAQAPIDAIKSSPVQAKAGQSKAQDNEKFYSPRESILDISRK